MVGEHFQHTNNELVVARRVFQHRVAFDEQLLSIHITAQHQQSENQAHRAAKRQVFAPRKEHV
jgi:hypothetical protein